MGCSHEEGARNLGWVVGSDEAKQIWMEENVEIWVAGFKRLAEFSRVFPQTDYAGLTMSLHQKWQFLQRLTPSVGPLFAPLEAELWDDFLLDRFVESIWEFTESLHKRIIWGVKWAGVGIPCPNQTTPANF